MPTATELRVGVEALTEHAARRLNPLWARFSTADAARDALERVLPELVRLYGTAATTYTADWYDATRYEQGVRGTYQAHMVNVTDEGADILARWGVDPLYAAQPNVAAARVLIAGGLQRRIANASRDTITESSYADPECRGWMRVGYGACDFCSMLIGRGAVYTEQTADFLTHDHCRCSAVPAWSL